MRMRTASNALAVVPKVEQFVSACYEGFGQDGSVDFLFWVLRVLVWE
jgi:hypothetical protein